MEPAYRKNNKEELPLEFYLKKFQEGDPADMAARCALPWDGERQILTVTFLGEAYAVKHPDFTIEGTGTLTNAERILFLRYLLDGQAIPPSGTFLTYRDFPWGEVYLRQFTGRCIQRFAFSYGKAPEQLRAAMSALPAVPVAQSDAGYDVTLMPGLTIRFLLWLGDEDFPPNGQILFSDNFRFAFTAEDMANIGDIVLNRLKRAVQ